MTSSAGSLHAEDPAPESPDASPTGDFAALIRERWRQNFLRGYLADTAGFAALLATAALLHGLVMPLPLGALAAIAGITLALDALPRLYSLRWPRAAPGPPLFVTFQILAVGFGASTALLDAAVGAPAAVFAGLILAAFWAPFPDLGLPAVLRPLLTAVSFAASYGAALHWDFPATSFAVALATAGAGGTLLGWYAATTHHRSLQSSYELNQALEQALKQARSAVRAKADFLANMSHEIRTPLNGVLGSLSLLEHGELVPEQREHLGISMASSRAALAIINDILDFSKIEAGKLELEDRDFEPAALVKEAVDIARAGGNLERVGLRTELDPELPPQARGDANRLRQVLLNLLSNALKFTERGEVTLRARVQHHEEAGYLLGFEVQDTGIGMTPEQLDRLFRPFVQADSSTTRRFGGTGLGLTICKQVIQSMGGNIEVESRPGQGSTFRFTLRLAPPSGEPRDAERGAAVERRRPAQLRGKRVLVAEDNRVNQMLILKMLQVLGVRPVLVGDGEEAVDRFPQERWDLVLMDCQMPRLDGYQATRRIRCREQDSPRIPVIAMTANTFAHDRALALEAGMDHHLAKPFDIEDLTEILYRWLPMEQAPVNGR